MIRKIILGLTILLSFGQLQPACATSFGTPLGPPGAPRNVAAVISTDTTTSDVVVSWVFPSADTGVTVDDGGDTITGYSAVAYNNVGGTWTATSSTCSTPPTSPMAPSESCTITGLAFGTQYKFLATASNTFGTGTSALIAVPVATNSLTQSVTISADRAKTVTYGSGDFRLFATSTGDPRITWQSAPTGICTVDATGVVHPVAVGICYVNAVQNGIGTNYLVAMDTSTVTVVPNLNVSIDAPSNIQGTSAKLNAIVGYSGVDIAPEFCISSSPIVSGCPKTLGAIATASPETITVSSATNITATVTGLTNGTSYYYWARVSYNGSTVYSAAETFTTLTGPTVNYSGSLSGVVGTAMTGTLTATGGSGLYTNWVANTLPTGLISTPSVSTAVISGTPTTIGTYHAVFLVTDSNGFTTEDDETFIISAASDTSTSGSSPTPEPTVPTEPIDLGPINIDPLAPGDSLGLLNKDGEKITTKIDKENLLQKVFGDGWEINVQGKNVVGDPAPLDSNGHIVMFPGLFAKTFGSGFKPNSEVRMYLFSTPILLGTFFTDKNGEFAYSAVIPAGISTGLHMIQVNGVTTNNKVRSATIGVTVAKLPNDVILKTVEGNTLAQVDIPETNAKSTLTFTSQVSSYPGLYKATYSRGILNMQAKLGYTGRITFPIKITTNGKTISKTVLLLVLPFSVTRPIFTPTGAQSTKISWIRANNALSYVVTDQGDLVCVAKKTSCAAKKIYGPASNLLITSLGNDETKSRGAKPVYTNTTPFEIGSIHFDLNKSVILPSEIIVLNSIIATYKSQGFTTLTIEGHTDSQGTEKLNNKLGLARANATKKKLSAEIKNGYRIINLGSKDPAVVEKSEAGYAANRRVVIKVK